MHCVAFQYMNSLEKNEYLEIRNTHKYEEICGSKGAGKRNSTFYDCGVLHLYTVSHSLTSLPTKGLMLREKKRCEHQ